MLLSPASLFCLMILCDGVEGCLVVMEDCEYQSTIHTHKELLEQERDCYLTYLLSMLFSLTCVYGYGTRCGSLPSFSLTLAARSHTVRT